MLRFYKELWFHKQSLATNVVGIFVTLLVCLIAISTLGIVYEMIVNPHLFNNSFGIFDTLG